MKLLEQHQKNCTCSYCRDGDPGKLHYGLNIPERWNEWNSWYVIKLPFRWYIRWTNHWFRKIGIDRRKLI